MALLIVHKKSVPRLAGNTPSNRRCLEFDSCEDVRFCDFLNHTFAKCVKQELSFFSQGCWVGSIFLFDFVWVDSFFPVFQSIIFSIPFLSLPLCFYLLFPFSILFVSSVFIYLSIFIFIFLLFSMYDLSRNLKNGFITNTWYLL